MSVIYLRSTTGSDANNGSTWALAKATLAAAVAAAGAGGTVYMSQAHAETTGAGITVATTGTNTSPVNIICGDDAAQPPTTFATTGSVTCTGSSALVLGGCNSYYGVQFKAGSGGSNGTITVSSTNTVWNRFEQCSFDLSGGFNGSTLSIGAFGSQFQTCDFVDCTVKFGAHAGQSINVGGCKFHWHGGSYNGSGTAPSFLFGLLYQNGLAVDILVEDVDLSALGTTTNMFDTTGFASQKFVLRYCKMPASWSGTLTATPTANFPGLRFGMYNCDNAATNYKMSIVDWAGQIETNTTNVRTGGASDGTTPISWKMTSSAKPAPNNPPTALYTDEIAIWNTDVGSPKTVTVETLRDNATALLDSEMWLEVSYLSATGTPLGAFITDIAAPLATPASQASSSATWNTSGMGNPNPRKLEVTFTPQMEGFIIARVALCKSSAIVLFVDPLLTIS